MPIGAYYKGHGSDVMDDMVNRYGEKKGKSVFYATANKRGLKPMAGGGVVSGWEDPAESVLRWRFRKAEEENQPSGIADPAITSLATTATGSPESVFRWRLRKAEEQATSPDVSPETSTAPATTTGETPLPWKTRMEAPAQQREQTPPEPVPVVTTGQNIQEDQAPSNTGDAASTTIPNRYSVQPERDVAPSPRISEIAPPPRPPSELDKRNQAYRAAEEEVLKQANTKIPLWRQIAAGVVGGAGRGMMGRLLLQQPGLDRAEKALELQRRGVQSELSIQAEADRSRLTQEQIDAAREGRMLLIAQRTATMKPALTMAELKQQALAAGATDQEAMDFVLKRSQAGEFASSPGGIFSRKTGKGPGGETVEPREPASKNPTELQLLADTQSTDPVVRDRAARILKDDEARRTRMNATNAQNRIDFQVHAGGTVEDDYIRAGEQYARTGIMPPLGMRADGRQKVLHYGNEWARTNGFSPSDIIMMQAAYRGDTRSLDNLKKQRDQIVSFEQTAQKNLGIFITAASKIPDAGSPWINSPLRILNEKLVGSANMAAVNAARTVANNEIAKVTSGGGLGGVLSDTARREVAEYNPKNATFKQTLAVARVLQQDMANRHSSMDDTIADITSRIGRGGNQAPASNPNPSGYVIGHVYGGLIYLGGDPLNGTNWKKK